jgi:hypothetical protein
MEKLYYNLSEEEFTKGRKILLWVVTVLFFLGGVYVAMLSPVFGIKSVKPIQSVAPFSICLIMGIAAAFSSIKRKDLFFLIDDDKVEFRYGLIRPKRYTFLWTDMKKIVMPHKERKAKIMFRNGTSFIVDLSYIQRKRSTLIRKHLYHAAKDKNIDVLKVISLGHHKAHPEMHT